MAIDPLLWANTPGLGMAPLQPAYQASGAATDPREDIARRLISAIGGDNRVMPGDRPIGALVRDPSTMTQAQQINEMQALGGFPQEGRATWTRGPSAAVSGLATLSGGGVPGVGTLAGYMAGRGVQNRQRELAGEITQGMAEAQERGSQARDQRDIAPQRDAFADAYEAGRQAARDAGRDQARDRDDISRSSRGSQTASFTRGDTRPF